MDSRFNLTIRKYFFIAFTLMLSCTFAPNFASAESQSNQNNGSNTSQSTAPSFFQGFFNFSSGSGLGKIISPIKNSFNFVVEKTADFVAPLFIAAPHDALKTGIADTQKSKNDGSKSKAVPKDPYASTSSSLTVTKNYFLNIGTALGQGSDTSANGLSDNFIGGSASNSGGFADDADSSKKPALKSYFDALPKGASGTAAETADANRTAGANSAANSNSGIMDQNATMLALVKNIIGRVSKLESAPRSTLVQQITNTYPQVGATGSVSYSPSYQAPYSVQPVSVSSGSGISIDSFNALSATVNNLSASISAIAASSTGTGSSFSTSTTRGVLSAGDNLSYDSANGVFSLATSTIQGMVSSMNLGSGTSTANVSTSTIRAMFANNVTGLSYNNSTGVTSLTSGYSIPTTASTTEWASRVSSQWNANGSNIYFTTGSVGIGAGAPQGKLDVAGQTLIGDGDRTSQSTFPFYISDSSDLGWKVADGSGTSKFELYAGFGGVNEMRLLNGVSLIGYGQNLTLGTDQNGSAITVLDDASGNVGIGTTNPLYKLSVNGTGHFSNTLSVWTGDNSGADIESKDITGSSIPLMVSGNTSGQIYGSNTEGRIIRIADGADEGYYDMGIDANRSFYISKGSVTDKALVIASDGKIGIGTTTPVSQLANTSANALDGAGTGSDLTNGLTWASNNPGYAISAVNNSAASNANGLFVKTTGSASTNRILSLNSNGDDVFVVQGDGNVISSGEMRVDGSGSFGTLNVGGGTFVDSLGQIWMARGSYRLTDQYGAILNAAGNYVSDPSGNLRGGDGNVLSDTSGNLSANGTGYFGSTVTASAFYGDGSHLTGITSFSTSTTRGVFSNTATGLSYSSSTGVTSLTSGYVIPTAASTTEWASKLSSQWATSGSNISYSAGNVGIGTTTPGNKLDVVGSVGLSGDLSFTGTTPTLYNSNAASRLNYGMLTSGGSGVQGGYFTVYGNNYAQANQRGGAEYVFDTRNSGTGGFSIFGTDGSTWTNYFKVASSGNIGIGTTTPSAKLAITGTAGTGDIFRIASSTDDSLLSVDYTGALSGGSSGLSFKSGGTDQNITLTPSGQGYVVLAGTRQAIISSTNTALSINFTDLSNAITFLGISGRAAAIGPSVFGVRVRSDGGYNFAGGTDTRTAADTGIWRNAPGVVEINSGTAGAWRDLIVRNLSLGTTSTSTTLALVGAAGKDVVDFASSTGASLLHITQAGNVGIGIAAPLYALDVNSAGNGFRVGTASTTKYLEYTSAIDGINVRNGSYAFSFKLDDSNSFNPTIDASTANGSLIIKGATTVVIPNSTSLAKAINIANYDGTAGSAVGIGLSADSGLAQKGLIAFQNQSVWGVGDMVFALNGTLDHSSATLSDSKLVIKGATGNVGIGTASPSGKLDVQGGYAYLNGLRISGTDNTNTIYQPSGSIGITTGAGGQGLFVAASGVSYASGAFGAGTASPGYALHVRPLATDKYGLYVDGLTSQTANLAQFNVAGVQKAFIDKDGGAYFGGNVGIGTTTPGYALAVGGDINFTGALRANGNPGTTGMVLLSNGASAPTWVATSTLGISGGASLSGGTTGYLARWTSASTLATGLFADNGTVAGINATSSAYTFNVQGGAATNPFNVASSTGTSLLTVLANGYVGVGTSTPLANLSVNANGASFTPITVGANSTFAANISDNVDAVSGVQMGNTSTGVTADFRFLVKDTTGNYMAFAVPGINNAQPNLFGLSRSSSSFIFNTGGTVRNLAIGTLDAKDLILGTNSAERLRITSAGFVGIGTSTPANALTVIGNGHFTTGLSVGGSSATTTGTRLMMTPGTIQSYSSAETTGRWSLGNGVVSNGVAGLLLNSSGGGATFSQNGAGIGQSTQQTLSFYTANGTTLIERARFDTTGFLGIGTTTPVAWLSVQGSTTAPTAALFTIASSTSAQLFTVLPSGNVGIGTSTPAFPLDVYASVVSTQTYGFLNASGVTGSAGPGANNYSIRAQGRIMAPEFNAVSDARLKNINFQLASEVALDVLVKLQPVSFNWKDQPTGQPILGFIAQDVESIIPNAVSKVATSNFPDQRTLDYNQITAVMVGAVKEIKIQLDALKDKINAMAGWFSPSGDRLNVKGMVCVDDVCVTKDQFKQMLLNSGSVMVVPSGNTGGTDAGSGSSGGGGQSGGDNGGDVSGGTGNIEGSLSDSGNAGADGPAGGGTSGTPETPPADPTSVQ